MANESRVSELILRLRDEVSANASKVNISISSVEKSITSLAGVAGVGLSFAGLVAGFEKSIMAAAEQEDAIARLKAALLAAGQFTEDYNESLLHQAEAFSRVSVYQHDAITEAQALLITFGASSSEIEHLTQLTLDLAAGMRIDLSSAAERVAKAVAGNTRAFKQLGIELDTTLPKQEAINKALDELSSRFAGQAAAQAETLGGSIKNLGKSFYELAESTGELANQAGATTVVHGLTAGINAIAEAIGRWKKALSGGQPFTSTEETGRLKAMQTALEQYQKAGQGASADAVRLRTEIEKLNVEITKPANSLDLPPDRVKEIAQADLAKGIELVKKGFQELGLQSNFSDKEMRQFGIDAFNLKQTFEQAKINSDQFNQGLRDLASEAIKSKIAVGELHEEVKGFLSVGDKKIELKEMVPTGPQSAVSDKIRAALVDARSQLSDLTKQGAEFGFLPDPGKLQELSIALKGFGELLAKEFGLDAPKDIQASQQSLSGLTDALAKKYEVQLTTGSAIDSLNKANEVLNNLRDNANNPIIIRTQTRPGGGKDTGTMSLEEALARLGIPGVASAGIPAGQDLRAIQKAFLDFTPTVSESPAVPFSKWLNDIAPAKVQAFADEVGNTQMNFNTDFSSAIVGTLNEIIKAKEDLARTTADIPFRTSLLGDFSVGPRVRLAALQDTLGFLRGMGTPAAAPSGGGGGGGGGPVTVNININGPITQELLDRQLVPKFERVIRDATGKNVDFRVFN